MNQMSGWVKNTGGFVEFPRDNYRYSESLSAMDGSEDSVSRIIAACLHTSDTRNTDFDGLTDRDELYGMLTSDFSVICTNPRKSDTDGDGLSDMDELGSEAVLPADVKNAFLKMIGNESDYYSSSKNELSVYSKMTSDPRKVDSDGDGYLDNGRNNDGKFVDSRPMVNDVHIYQIKSAGEYVPIIDDKTGTIDYYGGYQSWGNAGLTKCGCGLIAGENLMLYFALENDKYITPVLEENFKNIKNGKISKNEFTAYAEKLFTLFGKDAYFFSTRFGTLNLDLELGMDEQ